MANLYFGTQDCQFEGQHTLRDCRRRFQSSGAPRFRH
jgi:hypothetical protein